MAHNPHYHNKKRIVRLLDAFGSKFLKWKANNKRKGKKEKKKEDRYLIFKLTGSKFQTRIIFFQVVSNFVPELCPGQKLKKKVEFNFMVHVPLAVYFDSVLFV